MAAGCYLEHTPGGRCESRCDDVGVSKTVCMCMCDLTSAAAVMARGFCPAALNVSMKT